MKNIILKLDERVNAHKNLYIFLTLAAGLLMRFAVLYFTDNTDFRNFYQTGKITASGLNLYGNFKSYNYGPIMFIILGKIYKAALFFENNILAFKIMQVAILTIADLFIAKLVVKKSGLLWGIIFFLNPLSIIIDAHATQFDNIAIALGAYGICYLSKSCEDDKLYFFDIIGIALLSLSLIFKHVLWAFPLWILLNKNITTRKKFLYAFIPPLLFLLSFVPYWQEGSQGIIQNVFMYRSFNNYPLIGLNILNYLGLSIPFKNYISFPLFIMLMALCGYIFRREKICKNFMLYTIALVCCSSAIANQYLVIPVMALIILFREKSFIYFVIKFLLMPFGDIGQKIFSIFYKHLDISNNLIIVVTHSLFVWCLLAYLVYYYVNRKNFSELY